MVRCAKIASLIAHTMADGAAMYKRMAVVPGDPQRSNRYLRHAVRLEEVARNERDAARSFYMQAERPFGSKEI